MQCIVLRAKGEDGSHSYYGYVFLLIVEYGKDTVTEDEQEDRYCKQDDIFIEGSGIGYFKTIAETGRRTESRICIFNLLL